jgi:hypothetical protein
LPGAAGAWARQVDAGNVQSTSERTSRPPTSEARVFVRFVRQTVASRCVLDRTRVTRGRASDCGRAVADVFERRILTEQALDRIAPARRGSKWAVASPCAACSRPWMTVFMLTATDLRETVPVRDVDSAPWRDVRCQVSFDGAAPWPRGRPARSRTSLRGPRRHELVRRARTSGQSCRGSVLPSVSGAPRLRGRIQRRAFGRRRDRLISGSRSRLDLRFRSLFLNCEGANLADASRFSDAMGSCGRRARKNVGASRSRITEQSVERAAG